jgi:excisionase family DNA binding protein
MDQQSEWIRTPEAAKYLGVHIETVRRWAREGEIPAAKLGNRGGFRFRREDLDKFLERRRAEGIDLG